MRKVLLSLLLSFTLIASAQDSLYPQYDNCNIVNHTHYSLCYSEEHEQPFWVFYELTSDEVKGNINRTDNFREDPLIETGSASLDDYKYSGYDRGHLAPAADMAFSEIAMSESFYMSNMSPQNYSFNRGIWSKLEDNVRKWAVEREMLFVTTGPVLNDNYNRIGENQVAVPDFYYKVLLDTCMNTCIAFLLPNQKGEKNIMDYAVTVDSLERITCIDFNSFLPDEFESNIENTLNISDWPLAEEIIKDEVIAIDKQYRCSAITEKGEKCKRFTKHPSRLCWQHE